VYETPVPVAARKSAAARLLRLWVRIPPGPWTFVCCECCVYCQLEVSATSWSLIQRILTDCDPSLCVIYKPREWGGPGLLGGVAPKIKVYESPPSQLGQLYCSPRVHLLITVVWILIMSAECRNSVNFPYIYLVSNRLPSIPVFPNSASHTKELVVPMLRKSCFHQVLSTVFETR